MDVKLEKRIVDGLALLRQHHNELAFEKVKKYMDQGQPHGYTTFCAIGDTARILQEHHDEIKALGDEIHQRELAIMEWENSNGK